MERATELKVGKDIFALCDLLEKAAALKGLKLLEGDSKGHTKEIKTYQLDDHLIAHVLCAHDIKPHSRTDKIYTLADESCTHSNYWNFPLPEGGGAYDLRIRLEAVLRLDISRRGIVIVPQAHGTCTSPISDQAHFHMFKALVEGCNKRTPAIAKELASSGGNLVVTFTDLGLGGLRSLSDLFREFTHGNQNVWRIGDEGNVFNPRPLGYNGQDPFVAEPAQPRLFQAWRQQLDTYRESLRV